MPGQNLAAGGGNPSGFNVPGSYGFAPGTKPMGSQPSNGSNPLIAPMPSKQEMPPLNSPYSFSANGPGAPLPGGLGGAATGPGGVNATPGLFAGHAGDIARGLRDAGVPSNLASSLAAFLKGGAGYNPQVLQSIFASLQPQINRGQANIMEQFGSQGLGMSSPAAIGEGDFMSQVFLDEGQIASQLYEQSVQNYISILGGTQSHSRGINATIQDVMKSVNDIGTLGGMLSVSGGGGKSPSFTLGG